MISFTVIEILGVQNWLRPNFLILLFLIRKIKFLNKRGQSVKNAILQEVQNFISHPILIRFFAFDSS